MTFTSTLCRMATNPNHPNFEDIAYNSELPIYHLKDGVLYKRVGVWNRTWSNWLEQNGIIVCSEKAVYHPVIKIEDGIITTWETQKPNIANHFLQMDKSIMELYYPNLNFVQIGNHPYSKEGRLHKCWQVDNAQRDSHRIIYPHHEPKQHFVLPKDLGF